MVEIRYEFQWLKWLKLYMIFNGRGLSNGWTYIIYKKIHMTYVGNIFDYIEVLWKNIKRYTVDNIWELCCYFKTN